MKVRIAGYPDSVANYASALHALCIPFEISLLRESRPSWDALLLPGGGDLDPALYHQPNLGSHPPDSELDQRQLALLRDASAAGKPVLGICKGMQLIQVCFGGALVQHLPTAAAHQSLPAPPEGCPNTDQVHPTQAPGPSVLSRLYGHRFCVNSAHHQGVRTPAPKLTAIQFTEDGVVEALCHTSLPILGLQWHPERMCFSHSRPDTVDGSVLIQTFFNSF